MTNVNIAEFLRVVDHAAAMNERWLVPRRVSFRFFPGLEYGLPNAKGSAGSLLTNGSRAGGRTKLGTNRTTHQQFSVALGSYESPRKTDQLAP